MTLVFYSIATEAGEDEHHPNAFRIPHGEDDPVSLRDIQHYFPLGQNFHFTFQTDRASGVDVFVRICNCTLFAFVFSPEARLEGNIL